MATEWDVFALPVGGDPYDVTPTFLATLYDAREKTIRVELDGPGSGSFAISKLSSEATTVVLAKGNLVKVRIPEIDADYLFAFFLETGDFTLVSSDEQGGEMLRFGGRGALAYLEYARAWSTSMFPGGSDPVDGLWRAYAFGGGNEPGAILWRTIAEVTHVSHPYPALPLLTYDFDDNLDSDGNAWTDTDATAEMTYKVGDPVADIAKTLVETGVLTLQMGPDLDLHGYNDFGNDLTEVVRFAHGLNIASELKRQWVGPAVPESVMLVAGEKDNYAIVPASYASGIVLRHGFMTAFGTGATALTGQGRAELSKRAKATERVSFQIANRRTAVSLANPVTVGSVVGPNATAGRYLPGPTGSDNGDFWVGDKVTLHTGTSGWDYNEASVRVMAITIGRDDDNHELVILPEVELAPVTCPDPTPTGYYPPVGGPFSVDDPQLSHLCPTGYIAYGYPGHTNETGAPDPSYVGTWHFYDWEYAYASAQNPAGWVDLSGSGAENTIQIFVIGGGTITVYMPNAQSLTGVTYTARLTHLDSGHGVNDEVQADIPLGTNVTFTVPGLDSGYCIHIIWLEGFSPPGQGIAFDGFDWVADA